MTKAEQIKAKVQVTKAYRSIIGQNLDIERLEVLNQAVTNILEKIEEKEVNSDAWEFQETQNMEMYLKGCIRNGFINVRQETKDLVSLTVISNDFGHSEVRENKSYDLFKWIITQKDRQGDYLFTDRQRKVFSKKYLFEMNHTEIAKRLGVSSQAIDKTVKAIDKKLLTLPIRDMIDSRFIGNGLNTPKSQVYPDTDIEPTGITPLRKFRRTGNQTDLDKFHENSARCLKRHIKRGGNRPYFNDTPIADTKPFIPVYEPITRKVKPYITEQAQKSKTYNSKKVQEGLRLRKRDSAINSAYQRNHSRIDRLTASYPAFVEPKGKLDMIG